MEGSKSAMKKITIGNVIFPMIWVYFKVFLQKPNTNIYMASYARIFVYVILLFILSSTILLLLIPNWSLIQNHRLARMILGPRQRPNIIFILADDLGYNDVGYHDTNVLTPNIDSLSSHGITLDNYYTLCICSASRGVILTGRYDIHNGMRGIATQTSKKGISLNELLISDILHSSGYST